MKTVDEAQKFLEDVKKYATTNTRSGVAKKMGLTASNFNNQLLASLIIADVKPPKFASKSKKEKPKNTLTVMAKGKDNQGKRIRLEESILDAAGLIVGDVLNVKVTKGKIVLEKQELVTEGN